MTACVLVCGKVFDGITGTLTGPAEIVVQENQIAKSRIPDALEPVR